MKRFGLAVAFLCASLFCGRLTVDTAGANLQQPPPVGARVPPPQTFGDRAAVEFATREYVDAWKANDTRRVMATLLPDAVLLPSGLPPISGTDAIMRFWFPTAGPATRVIDMDLTIDDVKLDGDLAVVSGRGVLVYTTASPGAANAAPRTLRSWYVNVLRRQLDGRWLIARRAWSDLRT
jgi:uncharacterized protein (TIGR02246 family)